MLSFLFSLGIPYLDTLWKGHANFSQFGFNDAATPIMESLIDLHHTIFFYMIIIAITVIWTLFYIIASFNAAWALGTTVSKKSVVDRQRSFASFAFFRNLVHGTFIEAIWTLLPCVILLFIAVPSFALLYSMDEVVNPSVTVKIEGRQWLWVYEYSDYVTRDGANDINIVSNIINDEESIASPFDLRLLNVDNALVLPVNTHIRLLITAADVLHSWAVPALGVKMDAVPGRLNQVFIYVTDPGIYYGQCSELCGAYHGFMPIVLKAVDLGFYKKFILEKLQA